MNRYKIIYYYPHECVGDFYRFYETIMCDVDKLSLVFKFYSKNLHCRISKIYIEKNNEFKIIQRGLFNIKDTIYQI